MKSWLPWKYFLRRAARRRGFVDPVSFLARLRQFAQPSEVQEPIELIRAGVLFHARGLINTKVLQYNLDWVWPYWVERQFDPDDRSFLPRAFSFSHVNLTHRNWTGLGLPGDDRYVIVDPRGLVTPKHDGWSLDWWWIPDDGEPLHPSRTLEAEQELDTAGGLAVITRTWNAHGHLITRAEVEPAQTKEGLRRILRLSADVRSEMKGHLLLALRPANPEGAAFVDLVRPLPDGFLVDGDSHVSFVPSPDRWITSAYLQGDLSNRLETSTPVETKVECDSGLAAIAAVFAVTDNALCVEARLDLGPAGAAEAAPSTTARDLWKAALADAPHIQIPDTHWTRLYESAIRTLVLLSPHDVYPGPYTYRRFWFRDACLIMHALLALNMDDRVRRSLEIFPARQRVDGYFHSQEGEWDANGEVLWIADQYERMSNRLLDRKLLHALEKGARWIVRKRAATKGGNHSGLLPAGFSAEHLGPNDYYYWDDFWGYAGLLSAAALHARRGESATATAMSEEARNFASDIAASLEGLPPSVARSGIPASPYRRMDAGAIGSMVADYPLRLDTFGGKRVRATAEWLWTNHLHCGGFFQDMIHSGVNAYLSLALAQTFLRMGDLRYLELIRSVAELASPTGNWPEAIHPRTLGGCMGDGQHAWAAAEWILMMRALFVREENHELIIGSGIPAEWLSGESTISFGPTRTSFGAVSAQLERRNDYWVIAVRGDWHGAAPSIQVQVPGFEAFNLE
ncbi:MAG: hypothetical protein ACREIA_12350, partial [Opitutaceae bacterium]